MKILKVIHGYPLRYNAGSEVYSQSLCRELAKDHKVEVFSRFEDPFLADYTMRTESDGNILLHLINLPLERHRYRYRDSQVDQKFTEILKRFQPDIVHIGHLNHLSCSIIEQIPASIPIVYTLHDYWLICPRGQFIERNDQMALCAKQQDLKCAQNCYRGYFSGAEEDDEFDAKYWQEWFARRRDYLTKIVKRINLFLAPSKYLLARFQDHFHVPEEKIRYLDYGFDLGRFENRSRKNEAEFVFGYIGTHIPSKGVQLLIAAFNNLKGSCKLRIWGRTHAQNTVSLKAIANDNPVIEWMGEYDNTKITETVFNLVDAIVVPSIWVENSPLVIHEALQAKVAVITADAGGMAEQIQHMVNGLLFKHRDVNSLTAQMQLLIDQPELLLKLSRGYLYSADGHIPSMRCQGMELEVIYRELLNRAKFWRITFDTNPDDCNLHCVMCETHSRYNNEARNSKRRMDVALIRRVLEECSNSELREIIPSTMGEPLLYKNFTDIIAMCHEFGVKLNLTTNGTFPVKGAQKWAELIVPVTSDVKISINGACAATQEAIMIGSNFVKCVENIREFIKYRDLWASNGGNYCSVTFQLTFLTSNVDELADIVKLAIALGVVRVKGHHLWAHYPEIEKLSMRQNQQTIEHWNRVVKDLRELAADKIKLENFSILSEDATYDIDPTATCPFLGKEAWVAYDGRFNPCCAPDQLRRELGDFGNLYELSLAEIWNGSQYRKLCENYLKHPLCISCNMRR